MKWEVLDSNTNSTNDTLAELCSAGIGSEGTAVSSGK